MKRQGILDLWELGIVKAEGIYRTSAILSFMGRKVIAFWLSLTMVFGLVVIVDVTMDFTTTVGGITRYVNTTGDGGAYTSIQTAINEANPGDTIFVYEGTYYETLIVDTTINLTGENKGLTIIDGEVKSNVIKINADFVNITGFKLKRSDDGYRSAGIYLNNVQYCNVTNNIITSNNGTGIFLTFSSDNIISDNEICLNTYSGILCEFSSNGNFITGNDIYSNEDDGICFFQSGNNVISDNTIVYNDWSGVFFDSSFNNVVKYNHISNSEQGIWIGYSSYDNLVLGNLVVDNYDYGINIDDSTNNRVYHNIIANNVLTQAMDSMFSNYWDDGYPSGGNYWSDYSGVDNFRGPNQNISGGDGIGDTPHFFDFDTQDNYPLMESDIPPFENHITLLEGWNLISIPLIQEETELTKVLGAIDNHYNTVEWYNNGKIKNHWEINNKDKPSGNELTKINETMGFWIHITKPGRTYFGYNGTQPIENQTILLYPGWNLVGYPSLTSYNRTDALNNLTFDMHVDSIWMYNATIKKWKELGSSDHFEVGSGYWIYANTKCVWEVPL